MSDIERPPERKDAQEDPRAIAAAKQLMEASRFVRHNPENPETIIEIEGMKFSIEKIDSGEHPDIPKVQALFEKVFGAEEVDPEEILRAAIDGKTPWGDEDATKYQVTVIKNEAGEVISTFAGGRLDMKGPDGKPIHNKQMFMIGYAVTDENARQGGLAREAYISAIMQAAKEAQAEGKELACTVGECTYTSEKFWNSIGWKRVYAESRGKPGAHEELRYVQPALDFSEEDGAVAEGAGAAPEHLMISNFQETSPAKEDILAMVRGIYEWCNTWPPKAFADESGAVNEAALREHQKHVVGIWEQFKQQVVETGELTFLSKEEREELVRIGTFIEEHSEADHGNAGEEDF